METMLDGISRLFILLLSIRYGISGAEGAVRAFMPTVNVRDEASPIERLERAMLQLAFVVEQRDISHLTEQGEVDREEMVFLLRRIVELEEQLKMLLEEI